MLEGKPRRQAHLRIPEERSGGFLHCHREAVPGIALLWQKDIQTYNKYTQTKGIACEGGCWIFFSKSTCLYIDRVQTEIFQIRVLCFCINLIFTWPLRCELHAEPETLVTAGLLQSQQQKGERSPCCLNKLNCLM